jgi:hypothetical protein
MKKSVLVIGIILAIIIIALGIYYYPHIEETPETVSGSESLNIIITSLDNTPISNLEVDLWTEKDTQGPPSAGIVMTNSQGVATFNIPEGNYFVGFNQIGFPTQFEYQKKMPIIINKGANQKTIILQPKQ